MSELSKNQLTTENNNSFPNNNTGYITPTLLRTFNQNMIDSLVDEETYTTESGSFNARINALDPSGSAQALLALEQATASLNAYTQSQNSFNSSATASIVALQNFSSSLDTTYATDAQLSASVSALSASVTITTNGLSSSVGVLDSEVNALQSWSSSLDTTYATDAQLSASASTLQNNINAKLDSASFNSYTQSQTTISQSFDSRIDNLESWSSSLDTEYVTQTELSASASTLQNNINAKLDSASFNSYTQSNDSKVNSLINATGSYATLTQLSASASTLQTNIDGVSAQLNSYSSSTNLQLAQIQQRVSASATTGSNTFIGNQIISGNLDIEGSISAISGNFLYIKTIYETSSIIFSSGSNQLGDELTDVQTLSGSVKVQGVLTVNGVPVQTSSFDASGYLLTSSFNEYTESAASGVSASINSATQSLSSSIAVTTNNLDLEVNQKLDSSSFNAYTESNDIKVNALIAATGSYAISSSVASALNTLSASVDLTYATKTELSASASTLQNGINSKVENSTFNTYTSSQNSINQGLAAALATKLNTTTFNSYTSSNDGKVNSLIAATGSYITSAQTSSMTVLSASYSETASYALNVTPTDVTPFLSKSVFDAYTGSAALGVSESINSATQSLSSSIAVTTNNLDLEVNGKLDSSSFNSYTQSNDSVVNALVAATSSYVTEAETGSFITSAQTSSMSVLSASFAVTAAFAENATPTDVSMFVSQSTFNAYTQSNDSKVNSLIEKTGSYATTGSNTFIGNQIVSGNISVAGNISAVSASFQYVNTIYETASVIYSSGSNQLGDELSDIQTLSGSVKVQGGLTVNGTNVLLVGETASYASASISSSYALSASYSQTSSYSDGFNVSNYIDFNTGSATPAWKSGRIFWDNTDGCLAVYNNEADITLQVGQENWTRVWNDTGVPITNGAVVRLTGTHGDTPQVVLAASLAVSGAANLVNQVLGVATHTIETNTYGFITTQGLVRGLNTNAFNDGDTLFVSSAAGQVTNVISQAPYEIIPIGQVVKAGPGTSGIIYVAIQQPIDFTDLSSVIVDGTYQNGDMWVYEGTGSTGVWYHRNPSAIGLVTTSSFNSYTSSEATNVSASINSATSSLSASLTIMDNQKLFTSSFNTYTSSIALQISGLTTALGNKLNTTTFNSYTQSNDSKVNSLIAATGSYITSAQTSSMSVLSSSYSVTATSASYALSSSFATNANIATTASFVTGLPATIATLGYAITGSNSFVGNEVISGTLLVSSSQSAGIRFIGGISIVGDNNGNALNIYSGSVSVTTPQGSGSFYTNLPITSSHARFNGQSYIKRLNIEDNSGNADLQVENNVSITGSLNVGGDVTGTAFNKYASTGSNTFKGVQIISSSVRGEQYAGSVAGNTASFDCSTGNFFTLALNAGTNHISASNIRPGQTINVKVTTQSGNAVTCSTAIKQPSGSLYTPTNAAGTDILTFISYDTTLYLVAVKNFI